MIPIELLQYTSRFAAKVFVPIPALVTSPLSVRFWKPVAMASVYLLRVVAQRLFPFIREFLRHHVLDRQAVTGR